MATYSRPYHPILDHSRVQRPESRRPGYRPTLGLDEGPQSPTQPLLMRQLFEWSEWPELTVRLYGLHPSTTTWDIYRNFKEHGTVVLIELFESRTGREGTGKIRFAPPPQQAFWTKLGPHNLYQIHDEDGKSTYNARISLDERQRRFKIQSPIKKYIFYDEKMKLIPSALQFGTMMNPESMMTMETIHAAPKRELSFVVDLLRSRIVCTFSVDFKDPRSLGDKKFVSKSKVSQFDRENTYMFQIPFGQMKTIYRADLGDSKIALIISSDSPPQFYRKREDAKACHSKDGLLWTAFDTWYRQTDIVYDPFRLQTAIVTLHKERPVIDIGRWKTYKFVFNTKQNEATTYNVMKQALQDYNIEIVPIDTLHDVPAHPAQFWSWIDHLHTPYAVSELQSLDGKHGFKFLPFEVRYQLEVCISREILSEHKITREFVDTLAGIASTDSAKARNILEYIAEQQDKRIYDPMSIFQDHEALAFSPKTEIPHYCAYTRKATITPSTIYFSTPIVETTNRVLRRYSRENQDGRFLRVQFTDEIAEGRINSCADKRRNDELFTRVYRTLFNGIRIGDRHYQFLAFGNSQFRENGAYFFCPTDHLSCDDIRQWMGNFSHIKVVAKYAARLGQCFSTTRAINGLSKPDIIKIPDIKRNGYTFTDGVGKISLFLAQMITAELGLRVNTAPSAFQFRLGGCKGILVVSPDAKDNQVHIRRSQQKFTAVYNGLEIIRWSRFSCASLNRQTITILSSLGVPDKVFLKMLTEQLSKYQTAMSDLAVAQHLLSTYVDDNQMTITIATMINNGFMTEREPFVLSLLHLWRSWSIKLLKEKARIIVENGTFVLGCVDETGVLRGYTKPTVARGASFKEDELPQIFIQIPSKDDPNQYNVIEGICLVGRNPSLHPGDLRVVQAVNAPSLHHIRDVVVFPQTGDRDIPSMCSGGDLDGDDYFVIWDKELQPSEWNCDPMAYAAPEPTAQHRPVEVTDLMKFFVRFMKNDALPTIAHAHMAQADFIPLGVKDPKCLELAALHSRAVDYVKTGLPAEMPKRLTPGKWPHFMEKRFKPKEAIYHSEKILGQLYDKVETVNFTPQYEEPFDKRILRAYDVDDALLKSARQTKSHYDTAIRRIMAQQEIKTEFEVWSTFVLSRPRVGSDYKLQEEMARISDALKDRFRAICIEKAGSKDFTILGPFVAAMYKVTKEEMDIALAECRSTKMVGGREVPKRKMEPKYMPLMSFPWLFDEVLSRIATGSEESDPFDGLGLLPSPLKKDFSQSRKRQGGAKVDPEDYIQQDDGVMVHRGEELDLFRQDIESDDLSGESDFEEAVRDSLAFTAVEYGQEALNAASKKTNSPAGMLSGTGVEDVVTQSVLDGLVAPADKALQAHQLSMHSSTTSVVDAQLSSSFGDLRVVDSAFPERSGPEAEEQLFEEEEVEPEMVKSHLEKMAQVSGSGLEAEEQLYEEEDVVLEMEESSLEKAARLFGS